MHIELYHSPHCPACRALQRGRSVPPSVILRDVGRHLEQAACVGITQLPALVVNGRVVAQGAAVLPALQRLAPASAPT